MLTIAFCLYKYFPYGGLQRDFLRIAKEMESRGYNIRVYVISWQGECPSSFDIIYVPNKGLFNHSKDFHYYQWVSTHLRKHPCAIVFGFNKMPEIDIYYQADTCFAAKAFEEKGIFYRISPRCRHYLQFEEAVFSQGKATKILMLSKHQIPIYQKYWHTENSRFYLLPPGISKDRLYTNQPKNIRKSLRLENNISEETNLILSVGSDFKRKGVDRSIRAVASLPYEVLIKTLLVVIGQDNPSRMKNLAKSLNVERHVLFFSGRNDVANFMAAADVFMHPAYLENTGTVILESVASGLPVITTEACGYSDYIEEAHCGIVISEPFSQKEFNDSLKKMLEDTKFRKLCEKNARSYALQGNIYEMTTYVGDYIERLIQSHKQ